MPVRPTVELLADVLAVVALSLKHATIRYRMLQALTIQPQIVRSSASQILLET